MSTVSTPRMSLTLSSRRTSISADNTTPQSASTHRASTAAGGTGRRNRAALRDYYNLKANEAIEGLPTLAAADEPVVAPSVIDNPGFIAPDYVKQLIAKQNAEDLLRDATQIEREIRILDGEKKALVYNNYAKLIAATDTIRQMREKMDPLTPTTQSLQGDIAHVAELAADLRNTVRQAPLESGEVQKSKAQRDAARWALGAEDRLRKMIQSGESEAAGQHWMEVQKLLDKWNTVPGVEKIRRACSAIMASNGPE